MALKRLALLALTAIFLVGLAGTAMAQSPRFIVSSTPFQERATGVTETAGDVVLTVSFAGTIAAGTNLTISMIPFTAAITNTPTVDGDNLQCNGSPCGNVNLSVGVLPNSLVISFTANRPVALGDQIRIGSIRINDQASGVVFPDQVRAQLTVTPAGALQFDNISIVSVSTPLPTLAATFQTIPNLLQCLAQTVQRTILVTEQFPAVFTSLAQETSLSDTPPPTNSSQLEIKLTTVPGGLTTDVPASVPLVANGVVSSAALVFNPTASTPPDGGSGTRYTNATTRDITLIYDVTGTPDLGQIESALFTLAFTTTGAINTQQLGCVGAQVRLVPLSTTPAPARPGVTGPSRTIPRFIDPYVPAQPRQIVCVVGCTCNLKFPFVTNQAGFDTGIAIANTTQDPYGTPGQSGTIDMYFYGQNAPTPPRVTISPAVQAGGTYTGLISSMAPNFQGYVIAIANFQFCEGFAFIADRNFQNIAEGYLAMLIPDPNQFGGRRQPGFPLAGTISGTTAGGVLSGTVVINDAYGERLVH